MKKKVLVLILLLVVAYAVISMGASLNYASAQSNPDLISKAYFDNVRKSMDLSKEVFEAYMTKTITSRGEEKIVYDENFCGIYMDEDGILNVATLASRKYAKKFNGNIAYKYQTFSYNQLLKIQSELAEVMADYSVYSIGIDEKQNRVDIYTNTEKYNNDILQYLTERDLYFEEAINVIVEDNGGVSESANTAYGGDRICTQVLGIPDAFGTICANAYDTETGKYGVLTNKHVADLGTMYANGWLAPKIGSATKSKKSGTIDAAFVPFANQNNWNTTGYSTYAGVTYTNIQLGTETQIVQNAPIRKIGQTTGNNTGRIEYRDTVSLGLDHVFRFSNETRKGDSGGPVYIDDGGQNIFLIGMTFACPLEPDIYTYGIACRMTEVIRLLGVNPVTSECSGMYITANIGSSEIQIIGNNFIPSDGIISVPESINGRKVVQFNEYAFAHHPELKKVYIPTTVRAIAATAFYNSKNVVLYFADGFVQRRSGGAAIYIVAGGFPFFVSNWANLQGGARPYCDVTYEQQMLMPKVPDDGTNVRNLAGTVYCYAGGCAFGVYNWTNVGGYQPSTPIDGTAIDFAARPKDGTFVETLNGTAYVYAGKAPIKINSWNNIDGWHPATLVDGLSMILTDKPINDTFVTTISGKIFRFTNGKAVRINSWADVGGIKPSVLVDETVIVGYM